MLGGEQRVQLNSKVVQAIAHARARSHGEIRVHLSRRWFEPNPMARAQKIFSRLKIAQASEHGAVLLYINLRRRKMAVYADDRVYQRAGQGFWKKLLSDLRRDLRSTHYENAIAITVRRIGDKLSALFPAD